MEYLNITSYWKIFHADIIIVFILRRMLYSTHVVQFIIRIPAQQMLQVIPLSTEGKLISRILKYLEYATYNI